MAQVLMPLTALVLGMLGEFLHYRGNGGGEKGTCVRYLQALIIGLCDSYGGSKAVAKKFGVRSGTLALFLYYSSLSRHPEIQGGLLSELRKMYPEWRWPKRPMTCRDVELLALSFLRREVGISDETGLGFDEEIEGDPTELIVEEGKMVIFSAGSGKHGRGRSAAPRPEKRCCAVHPNEPTVGSRRIFSFGVCRRCNGRIGHALKRSRTNKATEEDRMLVSFLKDEQEDGVLAWLQSRDMMKCLVPTSGNKSTEKRVHV